MSQSFNYRHLFYFWVVAKEGGIARAAERLDMAVQTISAQVRELERALGHQLLRPAGRTVALTDAGRAASMFALASTCASRPSRPGLPVSCRAVRASSRTASDSASPRPPALRPALPGF